MADNLASHRRPDIRAAIRGAGAKLFLLPKYSPDLNPIEQVFAKLKDLLRNTRTCLGQQETRERKIPLIPAKAGIQVSHKKG